MASSSMAKRWLASMTARHKCQRRAARRLRTGVSGRLRPRSPAPDRAFATLPADYAQGRHVAHEARPALVRSGSQRAVAIYP
jgi:hypothetical protein